MARPPKTSSTPKNAQTYQYPESDLPARPKIGAQDRPEWLRNEVRAPVLRTPGNQTVTLKNIRPPAKTLALSAEAVVDVGQAFSLPVRGASLPRVRAGGKMPPEPAGKDACPTTPVAILFGLENGPLSERLVREAWDELLGLDTFAPVTMEADHLKAAGTTSAPFPAGEHGQIAVKVIDPRGNELLVVKKLEKTK